MEPSPFMPEAAETEERGRVLLSIARESLAEAFGLDRVPRPAEPWLAEPGACFVTLMKDGELRGCIGSLEAERALGEDVAENARAAALRDPRFAPLTAAEWPRCRVEVSLLSVRHSRLRQLAEEGHVGAQAALNLLANPGRLLSVTQVGVTLASLGLGWAGEDTIYHLLVAIFGPLTTPPMSTCSPLA